MRISSVTMFDQSVSSMNRQQSDFLQVSQQIASGRRVVNPSDDPKASSQAVGVSQAQAANEQYASSRISARNALSQSESVLNSVNDAVASAKTLLVQASSDTLSDVDRQSVASELRGIYETMFGQANATDGNGRYLFGGYQDSSPPFVRDPVSGDVNYVGDTNRREQRIDASRRMAVADNGVDIFQSVPSGAGYVAEAGRFDATGTRTGDNTGDVTFSGPETLDNKDPDFGKAFEVTYDAGASEYQVSIDGTPTTTVPFQAGGQSIEVGGISLGLEGQPDDGDSFRFAPADQMNTDLFRSFERALAVLETPADTPEAKAELRNSLKTSMRELDNGLDNVLTRRASVGARLNELDVVDAVAGNRMINLEQKMSDLVDLDYSEAIAEYSLRQVGLQASQKAFVDIKGMSLFDMLR